MAEDQTPTPPASIDWIKHYSDVAPAYGITLVDVRDAARSFLVRNARAASETYAMLSGYMATAFITRMKADLDLAAARYLSTSMPDPAYEAICAYEPEPPKFWCQAGEHEVVGTPALAFHDGDDAACDDHLTAALERLGLVVAGGWSVMARPLPEPDPEAEPDAHSAWLDECDRRADVIADHYRDTRPSPSIRYPFDPQRENR